MLLKREKTEHTYTRLHRMRVWLEVLAKLAASHTEAGRAGRVAHEALGTMDVHVCMFQRLTGGAANPGPETFALAQQNSLSAEWLNQIGARISADVAATQSTQVINNITARYPSERLFAVNDIGSCLGVPLLSAQGAVQAVAIVLAGSGREFDEEDEWWLRAASQPVADSLSYETMEAKLKKLERSLLPPEADAVGGEGSSSESRKLTVLVIDDDRTVNDVLVEFLSDEGYRVESAYDGLEGVRMFSPAEHDVVMTDVAMPHMNGWEVIATIRGRAPNVPVVLITGYSSGNWNESYLRKQGVAAVVSKPLDFDRVTAVIHETVAKIKTNRPDNT